MSVPDAIAAAYDPERFRADGHRLIDEIANQLASWHARDGVVLPWRPRQGHAYEAFAQEASYLLARTRPAETWWDLGQRTLECTKRMMAIELWCALRVHGEAWFGQVVDRLFALAGALADQVAAAPDFELALAPEANIVCYRHRPAGVADLDAHLRSTIMNPLSEPSDAGALLDHLRGLWRS